MRHFSGDFTGIRPLMLDELFAISGGDGEDTDDVAPGCEYPSPYIPPPPIPPTIPPSGGGISPPPENPEDPENPNGH